MVRLVRSAARRFSAWTTASLRAISRARSAASRACASVSDGGDGGSDGNGGRRSVAVRACGAAASASYCRLGCRPPLLPAATDAKADDEPPRNRWRSAAAALRPSVASSAVGRRCTMAAVW
jgi:hypothetical protein